MLNAGLQNFVEQQRAPSREEKITWKPVPPRYLSHDIELLERHDAARQLWNVLLPSTGQKQTPVLDQVYGSGKTSLVWKFRSIYSNENNEESKQLKNAIYLHVRFDEDEGQTLPPDGADDSQFKKTAEATICSALLRALRAASNGAFMKDFSGDSSSEAITMDALFERIPEGNGVTFLVHFDEVGLFEMKVDDDRSRKMLYCIWFTAEKFQRRRHFYVLSGRSRILHVMGRQFNRLKNWQSPCETVLIALNNLSSGSIKRIFETRGGACAQWIANEENLKSLQILTGGMPRAVHVAAEFVWLNASVTQLALQQRLQTSCPDIFTLHDSTTFRHLVEISWAGIGLNHSEIYRCDGFVEPLSAVLARFGINSSGVEDEAGLRRIEVPLFQVRSQSWATASLRNIVNYSEPGDRLETGFRRVLFLRLSVLDASNWSAIGLEYLDKCGVPFLAEDVDVTDMFNFPKISTSARGSADTAEKFMAIAHTEWKEESVFDPDRATSQLPPRQVFPPSFLEQLSTLMKIGQFYLPLPRSSSADAKMRVGQNIMIDWQFKNFMSPIKQTTIETEARQCGIAGWTVYLIIICTAGHEVNHGNDSSFSVDGVTVIALSKSSVSKYLGPDFVEKLRSKGLAADQTKRLSSCTSPLKRKYQSRARAEEGGH